MISCSYELKLFNAQSMRGELTDCEKSSLLVELSRPSALLRLRGELRAEIEHTDGETPLAAAAAD